MEWPNEATYNHKAGAGASTSVGGAVSTDKVANINLEIKEEHDGHATRPSEIKENQMAVDVGNTSNDMQMERAQEIEENEEEIKEVVVSGKLQPYVEIPSGGDGDDVYVAVGNRDSSLDALSWALNNAVKPGSFVYLIHVFPEVQKIPTPLGPMLKNSLSKEQVDIYMNQQRNMRREMLQKYLNLCRKSKVEFDVHLIESTQVENAIVELIPVLHMKILVVGTSKRNLRRLRQGGTKAGIIQRKAPHYCEVKIICEGKDISTITTAPDQTPPSSPLQSENTETNIRPPTPRSPLSPEIPISRIGSSPRKKNKLKNLFRFFSCATDRY